ncbi:copper resistance CopC family protein [Sporichthya polymorpha]|uniref:copper resistance CopC family protein n=1 Tax=Sporichthya polymorpha TaxID=35751 RepID=UPI000A03F0F4|nr:copper resistance CopC family protein [Sporichthya polymorpha]
MFVNGFTRVGAAVRARFLVTLVLLTVGQLALATGAVAHTGLVGCAPAYDATLAAAPKDVRLTFSEPVRSEFVEMTVRVDGTAVPGTRPVVAGPVVRVDTSAVPADTTPREWTVAYRVVASDGHPINGTLRFATDPAAPAATGEVSAACAGSGGNSGVAKAAAVTGGILLVLGVAVAVIRRRVLAA